MTDHDARYILRNTDVRHNAVAYISSLPVSDDSPLEVLVQEYKPSRTLAQNRLYWWWLRHIADFINGSGGAQVADADTGEVLDHTITTNDLHDWFRAEFLGRRAVYVNGVMREAAMSTTRLSVREFTNYLNRIEEHCRERMGLFLPHPVYYAEAMGHAA